MGSTSPPCWRAGVLVQRELFYHRLVVMEWTTTRAEAVDWPSERFETLWKKLRAAAPAGKFTTNLIQSSGHDWSSCCGRLEQATPLGPAHPDGFEWFVRPENGAPIAAYVSDANGVVTGQQVCVIGLELGTLKLIDRSGALHEYKALVGRPTDAAVRLALSLPSAAQIPSTAQSWLIGATLIAALAWAIVRIALAPSPATPRQSNNRASHE